MSASVVVWESTMEPICSAVVAIGVFDGVHLGHQSLLADTVADAAARGVEAVAVTFDRDPDQVVSVETAAPQLLTLSDKLAFISDAGVGAILVIPFTHQLAEMSPGAFLEAVLVRGVTPLAVHVGRDFRFGRRAAGDVVGLQLSGVAHGFEVHPHDLVAYQGSPVTSSRIRALVAAGDVTRATRLLGRPPRVAGLVHRGRGEGEQLGFPTANVVPVEFAALPADGVYAGRALLGGSTYWPAAVSVGTPPTFPEAPDYLEAHLIGFKGDLYDQPITLEFLRRLRPLQAFASLEALKSAIAEDVRHCMDPDSPPSDGASEYAADMEQDTWVAVLDPIPFSSALGAAGWKAFMVTSPLEAAGIPFMWDPYPPEERPTGIPAAPADVHPFTLMVPQAQAEEARAVLAQAMSEETAPAEEPGETVESVDVAESAAAAAAAAAADVDVDGIEDPDALEAAEQAVRGIDPDSVRPPFQPREGWARIAKDMPYDKPRLGAISYALSAAGILAEWEPFQPEEAPLLRLFGLRETKFSLCVPQEDAEAARMLTAEVDGRADGRSEV